MTVAQRMLIGQLGPDVLRATERLQSCLLSFGKADAALWREFLEKLMRGPNAEVMNTPLGIALQWALQNCPMQVQ